VHADLEFDPRLNPHVDGNGLVDVLVAECASLMKVFASIALMR